jgi:hypothetical protein
MADCKHEAYGHYERKATGGLWYRWRQCLYCGYLDQASMTHAVSPRALVLSYCHAGYRFLRGPVARLAYRIGSQPLDHWTRVLGALMLSVPVCGLGVLLGLLWPWVLGAGYTMLACWLLYRRIA